MDWKEKSTCSTPLDKSNPDYFIYPALFAFGIRICNLPGWCEIGGPMSFRYPVILVLCVEGYFAIILF